MDNLTTPCLLLTEALALHSQLVNPDSVGREKIKQMVMKLKKAAHLQSQGEPLCPVNIQDVLKGDPTNLTLFRVLICEHTGKSTRVTMHIVYVCVPARWHVCTQALLKGQLCFAENPCWHCYSGRAPPLLLDALPGLQPLRELPAGLSPVPLAVWMLSWLCS